MAPTNVEAASCTIIEYYADATYEQYVGYWSNCPGMKGLHGKRTKYSQRTTTSTVSPLVAARTGITSKELGIIDLSRRAASQCNVGGWPCHCQVDGIETSCEFASWCLKVHFCERALAVK
jgi:hypothetical protein